MMIDLENLSGDERQRLADELFTAGVRPSEDTDESRERKALTANLNDLRQLIGLTFQKDQQVLALISGIARKQDRAEPKGDAPTE